MDVKYSIGNVVNNIVISAYVPGGYLKYWGGRTLYKVYNCLITMLFTPN